MSKELDDALLTQAILQGCLDGIEDCGTLEYDADWRSRRDALQATLKREIEWLMAKAGVVPQC